MKKQRGLQIVLSAAIAGGQFVSGQIVNAQETDLRPASADVAMQSVPATQSSIVPVVYLSFSESSSTQTGTSTSVNAELQKLFHTNSQPPIEGDSLIGGNDIQLVQMSQGTQSDSQQDSQKKPGFFRRLFGSRNKQIPGVGEPAPSIPAPPPISYDTNGSRRRASWGNRQVPGVSVSFGSSDAFANQKASTPIVTSKRQTQANEFLRGAQNRLRQGADADGFINPFESQETPAENDVLLDLDSLVEDSSTTVASKTQPVTQQPVSESPASEQEFEEESPAAQANGPYTGYRLELKQPAAEQPSELTERRQLPRVASMQQLRAEQVESRALPVRELPFVESEVDSVDSSDAGTYRIPLLEEPEMELPIADEKSQVSHPQAALQIQSIPLLEEEFVSIPELPEEETHEPARTIRPIAPVEESTNQLSAAERLAQMESLARREQQAYRIMARTGQVGFKGFCPVELRDSRQLIDSRREYKAKFGLQTYYFSSPECKAAFDANPARYAPAAGGSDIVLLVNTNEEVTGNLEFSLWYRDRLYLFRSRETRRIFGDNPTRFVDQY